jgi:hypothetical protein
MSRITNRGSQELMVLLLQILEETAMAMAIIRH